MSFMKDPLNPLSSALPAASRASRMWADVPGRENVLMLTALNFDSTLGAEEEALVMFYAPCK